MKIASTIPDINEFLLNPKTPERTGKRQTEKTSYVLVSTIYKKQMKEKERIEEEKDRKKEETRKQKRIQKKQQNNEKVSNKKLSQNIKNQTSHQKEFLTLYKSSGHQIQFFL